MLQQGAVPGCLVPLQTRKVQTADQKMHTLYGLIDKVGSNHFSIPNKEKEKSEETGPTDLVRPP